MPKCSHIVLALLLVGCANQEQECRRATDWVKYYERCVNTPNCGLDAWDLAELEREREAVLRWCSV